MKVLIIEDELPQAQQLEQYITEIDSAIELVQIIPSVNQSIVFLMMKEVDLIFLDIHLSDGLCFEIFEKVDITCPVIFTTAYDKYAIEAFKHNGIDYLLKPIEKNQLKKSIDKFKLFTTSSIDYSFILNSIKSLATNTTNFKKRFVCQSGKKLRIVTDADIAYFYAFEGSVFITTRKNENLLLDETLEHLEHELDPYDFFRLNRKIIAHVSAIKEMIPYSKSRLKIELIPAFNEVVIVSYQNIRDFMKWIKK
ncbi:MAG: LytR/AlgR family response regulator transcription factor [Prolixibacteraceae bacterium]